MKKIKGDNNEKNYKILIGILMLTPIYIVFMPLASAIFNSIGSIFICFFGGPVIGFVLAYKHYREKINKASIIIYFVGIVVLLGYIIFVYAEDYFHLGIFSSGFDGIGEFSLGLLICLYFYRLCSFIFYGRIVGYKLMFILLGIYVFLNICLYMRI